MALNLEDLKEEALALPEEQRRSLIGSLYDSLSNSAQHEVSESQLGEFRRRAEEVRNGTAVLVSYEVVQERISKRLRRA